MTQEVVVYQAEGAHLRDIVDAGLSVLLKVDIHAFVELKDKYLAQGLKQAIRVHDHPFWSTEGGAMWEEMKTAINTRLQDGFWFGQHEEAPDVVGIFKSE